MFIYIVSTNDGYVKERHNYTQEIELAKFYKTLREAQKEAKMKRHRHPEILRWFLKRNVQLINYFHYLTI